MTPAQVHWWAKVCLLLFIAYVTVGVLLYRACG